MIGFYNYTVILTYISLVISSVGIGFAVTGNPFSAMLCHALPYGIRCLRYVRRHDRPHP